MIEWPSRSLYCFPLFFYMGFKLRIETYTHGVRISNYTPETYNLFKGYLSKLVLKEPKNVPGGRIIMEEKKKYFGETSDKKEVYIHRYCLDDFLSHLEQYNIPKHDIEFIQIPVPTALPANYKLFEKYQLRDYQDIIKTDILRPIQSARVDLYTGFGKAISHGTPIKTPTGWVNIESLEVGDWVVGQDGMPTKVLNVYPQGVLKLYRVTFEDGRYLDVCENHLWFVNAKFSRTVVSDEVDTKTMMEYLDNRVMLTVPVYNPKVNPDAIPESLRDLIVAPDGHYKTIDDECVEFTVTTMEEALQIREDLWSIGGIAKIGTTPNRFHVSGELDVSSIEVVSVEPIEAGHATCIAVDNANKLYVAKDYIVTHNTLTSLATIADIACKFTVMIPPKYFGLWTKALDETYMGLGKRYITISGSAALQNLIDRALDNDLDDMDIFIISNITYRTFIEAFELHGDKLDKVGYNVVPTRFHELLGVGCQINDEIQEDPGLLFRTDIYTNIAKQIYLSATPFTGNAYVTKMIDKMLPPETSVRLPEYKAYIHCLGLVYNELGIKPKHYLTPFKNTYNHARYETQMLMNDKRHSRYLRMVKKIAEGVYVNDRKEGQKLLILCATVAFIGQMVEYLRDQFPDLEINEHVAGCPYERLLTNDITVSTIKSSGTGVDIPNLREVILLQATGSKKDTIQILGRLRPLKSFPDVSPRLTYMICENIPHHLRYSGLTQEVFKDRTSESSIKRINVQ